MIYADFENILAKAKSEESYLYEEILKTCCLQLWL